MSLDEAARRLGLGHGTVLKLIQRGELRAVRLGRQWRVSLFALAELLGDSTPHTDATGSQPESGAANRALPITSPIPTAPERELERDGSD